MANDLTLNLRLIAEALPSVVDERLHDAAYTVENHAKENCPVDSGTLRGSINHTDPENNSVTIGTNIEYAVPVHKNFVAIYSNIY